MNSINNIPALMLNAGASSNGVDRVLIQHEIELAKQFLVGQTLQLRIIAKLGPQRFSVMLAGGERVMESSLPLKAGDVLHGRVTELGEQIVIERTRVDQQSASAAQAASANAAALLSGELLSQGRVGLQRPLSRTERQAIDAAAKKNKEPLLTQNMGLALRNLNVDVSQKSVAEAVELYKKNSAIDAVERVEIIESGINHVESLHEDDVQETPLEKLAASLKQAVEGEENSNARLEGLELATDAELFQRFMNASDSSCIRHRSNTALLLCDGRVVPVGLAIFEQKNSDENFSSKNIDIVGYRSGVINLTTEILGDLAIHFLLSGDQLSVSLTGNNENAILKLEASSESLQTSLHEDGWTPASLRYEFKQEAIEGAAGAVLAHLANLDRYEAYV